MRDPLPVSVPPWMPPPQAAVGNTGPQYGIQSRQDWEAGKSDERCVIDSVKAGALWRVSIFGPVRVRITYGTAATIQVPELRAPVIMTLPGQLSVYVKPSSSDGGCSCLVTLTQATAGLRSVARRVAVGPETLDDNAVAFTALSACTMVIAGFAVAVPALSTVPLVAGASLTTGSGFQEFEA